MGASDSTNRRSSTIGLALLDPALAQIKAMALVLNGLTESINWRIRAISVQWPWASSRKQALPNPWP